MISLSLVTGFLGSGKTTYLQHLADTTKDGRLIFLVNEFSAQDVDGSRIELEQGELISIPGGSIFCKCLVSDFIRILREVRTMIKSSDENILGVVVEASGIANPKVVEKMLEETELDRDFCLSSVITAVDPEKLPKLLVVLPNVKDQIESADYILLNKCDLHDEEMLGGTENKLREINASAKIIRTEFSKADVDLFADKHQKGLRGAYAECADPNYASVSAEFDAPIDVDKFKNACDTSGIDFYRIKGTVNTTQGWKDLDFSPSGWNCVGAKEQPTSAAVFIAHGSEAEKLEKLAEMVKG